MKQVIVRDNIFHIKFYGADFTETLHSVRGMPGRKWDKERKIWTVPINIYSARELKKIGFNVPSEYLKQDLPKIEFPEGLALYPFQEKGVQLLEKFNGRALLADQMGLGKTIQSLAYLKLHPELRPAVIVCPASIKINWQKEITKWLQVDSTIIQGKKQPITGSDIIILNYEVVAAHKENIQGINPKILILDESHYIKNYKAKRTKVVVSLAKKINRLICLTGTPILSRPVEMFTSLNLLNPELFPSWWNYATRYCDMKSDGFGLDSSGASNTEELHKVLISTCMIRRTKEEVLPDLPEKTITTIPVKIDITEYNKLIDEFLDKKIGRSSEMFAEIEGMKQAAAQSKMPAVFEWIDNFLDNKDKLVIMAIHHKITDQLVEKYKDISVKLDGRDSIESKNVSVELFQSDPRIRLFIGGLKAAGVGLNLTAADTMLFIEFGWTPGEHTQAEDRIHRIGQDDKVNIYYMIAQDTFEESIIELLDEKRKILDKIMDGQEVDEKSLLSVILNHMKELGHAR